MALRGLDICVSSTSFQISIIGWPQQPPTGKVLKSVKNWIFESDVRALMVGEVIKLNLVQI